MFLNHATLCLYDLLRVLYRLQCACDSPGGCGGTSKCRSPGPSTGTQRHWVCGLLGNLYFSRTPIDCNMEGGFLVLNQASEETDQDPSPFQNSVCKTVLKGLPYPKSLSHSGTQVSFIPMSIQQALSELNAHERVKHRAVCQVGPEHSPGGGSQHQGRYQDAHRHRAAIRTVHRLCAGRQGHNEDALPLLLLLLHLLI